MCTGEHTAEHIHRWTHTLVNTHTGWNTQLYNSRSTRCLGEGGFCARDFGNREGQKETHRLLIFCQYIFLWPISTAKMGSDQQRQNHWCETVRGWVLGRRERMSFLSCVPLSSFWSLGLSASHMNTHRVAPCGKHFAHSTVDFFFQNALNTAFQVLYAESM